jgi:Zn ribbon nucleic-acid-binding protein
MNINICPICGHQLIIRTWHEDYYRVETDEKCFKCGYHKNEAYGNTEISFRGAIEGFSYNVNMNNYCNILRRLNKARWKYRKFLLRTGKIKGKNFSRFF